MKTQHFNRIKLILNNEKNESKHLPSLKNIIKQYEVNFGSCNLSNVLWMQYFNVYTKLNFEA